MLVSFHHLLTGYWWLGACSDRRSESVAAAPLCERMRDALPGIAFRLSASRLRSHHSAPLLRAILAHAGNADGKWDSVAECPGSGDRNRRQSLSGKKTGEVRRAVIDGANLSARSAAQHLFPELFTDMMAVGEQTGHFAQTMQTIADVYERELDRTVEIVSELIPPVIIAAHRHRCRFRCLQYSLGGFRDDSAACRSARTKLLSVLDVPTGSGLRGSLPPGNPRARAGSIRRVSLPALHFSHQSDGCPTSAWLDLRQNAPPIPLRKMRPPGWSRSIWFRCRPAKVCKPTPFFASAFPIRARICNCFFCASFSMTNRSNGP